MSIFCNSKRLFITLSAIFSIAACGSLFAASFNYSHARTGTCTWRDDTSSSSYYLKYPKVNTITLKSSSSGSTIGSFRVYVDQQGAICQPDEVVGSMRLNVRDVPGSSTPTFQISVQVECCKLK